MGCPFQHPTCHRETEAICPTRDSDGSIVCLLGSEMTIYKLVPKADGTVDLQLSHTHREHLKLIAVRGEIEYDYSKLVDKPEWLAKKMEPLAQHMRHLVTMGLVREFPIVGRSAVHQRLSEAGRKIVAMIVANESAPGSNQRGIQ